jgi:uncharacterized membrane protein YeaQ/YmgE (transglycosylase-associated protein family)
MLKFVLYLVLLAIVSGHIARLVVPGPDPMTFVQTIVLGIVGSFIGGFLGYVMFDEDVHEGPLQPAGLVGSVLGSVLAVVIYRVATRNTARGI